MVILGLGSNIGDRLGYLREAVARLAPLVADMRLSSIYQSPAMLPADAPPGNDHPFLNMALAGTTTLTPDALFAEVKQIERDLGRVRRFAWGPREIDIDILAMGDLVLKSEHLTIPHPGMLARDFVMLPLQQVAPGWRYPIAGDDYGKCASDIIVARGYALSAHFTDTGWSLHAR